MAAGVMLNCTRPIPIRSASTAGSDAISPHTDSGTVPHDVRQIARALPEIRILDRIEDRPQMVEDLLERPFGVHQLLAHDRLCPRQQHRIVEHQALRLEQGAEITAGQAPLDAIQLLRGSAARCIEAGDLCVDARRGD